MDVLLSVLSVAVGVTLGLLVYDMRSRAAALAKLISAEARLEGAAKAMSDAHNSMAVRVMELSDRVQGHELKLTSVGGTTVRPNPFGGPRA